jgi:hypothetical protein
MDKGNVAKHWLEHSALLNLVVVSTVALMVYARQVTLKTHKTGWVLVSHSCNPSGSGGRDQEDLSMKPAWANSS